MTRVLKCVGSITYKGTRLSLSHGAQYDADSYDKFQHEECVNSNPPQEMPSLTEQRWIASALPPAGEAWHSAKPDSPPKHLHTDPALF